MVCNQALKETKASAAAAAAKAAAFELRERLAAAEAALRESKEKQVSPRLLSRSALSALGWLKGAFRT